MLLKVETLGSYWWIDQEGLCYIRLPKHEGPRQEPYLSMSNGTVLEDQVWHPFTKWEIGSDGRLRIWYEVDGGEEKLSAPDARLVDGRA